MVTLRATKKVLRYLRSPDHTIGPSDGALGDWYANRLVVDRRPLILLVSSESLLAIVIPGKDVKSLPERLPVVVRNRLRRLGAAPSVIEAEVETLTPAMVAVTSDRSIVGSMVDFTRAVPHYLPIGGWDDTSLPFVEQRLGETPCRVTGKEEITVWPARGAQMLLTRRWGTHSV